MNFLIVFFILSIVNVIFATTKSLVTIKGNKLTAALVSGGYYAFYNIMLIYIVTDFPIWQKCIVTFICNVIGVFVVKWFEEKTQKEKLWKVELTVPTEYLEVIDKCPVAHNFRNIQSADMPFQRFFRIPQTAACLTDGFNGVHECHVGYDDAFSAADRAGSGTVERIETGGLSAVFRKKLSDFIRNAHIGSRR